ncbi:AAA family ATPase [Psychromonas sp. L1A2]|uniref:AAA family ATPase n=1 Tax=Psychromonas sp. L1A2 TaxID=2686356 RepID=UPI001358DEA0|nr:AAA family ATPase [Psychromonas sp. L1A2]
MNDNNLSEYKVFFCHGIPPNRDLSIGQIYIWPTDNSWNDFIHKTHCNYVTKGANGDVVKGSILVALLSNQEGIKGQGLGNVEVNKIKPSAHFGDWYSLLPSMQEYRKIIQELGVEQGNFFLKSLNDLVYLQDKKSNSVLFLNALKSEAFSLSFMRNSEPFFAFNNASSLLQGLAFEEFNTLSKSFDLQFQLDGFQNKHEVFLKYSSDGIIPKRINVLIGKNGLGKSQTLNNFVRGALQQRGYKDTLTSRGERPSISRILAIGTPGETKHTYPEDKVRNLKLNYKRLLLTRNGKSRYGRGIGQSLLLLARNEELIGEEFRWDIFINALSKYFDVSELHLPSETQSEEKYIPLKRLPNGWNEQLRLEIWGSISNNAEPRLKKGESFHPLSSGQLSFFKFALLTCLHIENGSFLLLDEPETHLHPNLISDFVALLDYLLEQTGSYALIATHSAYFVREVPREQVHVFKSVEQGAIFITPPRLKTFGADVSAISHFVFDEDIDTSLTQKLVEKIKEKSLSFEEVFEQYRTELSNETLMLIRQQLEGDE